MAWALAGAASRAAMVAGMAVLPPARADGLGAAAGDVPRPSVIAALVIAAAAGALAMGVGLGAAAVAALLAAAVGACAVGGLALRKFGGRTGDVLGAQQQVAEAAALTAMTVL